jgi:hypothetical protein
VVIRTSPRSIRVAHSVASGLAVRRTRADLSISHEVTAKPAPNAGVGQITENVYEPGQGSTLTGEQGIAAS